MEIAAAEQNKEKRMKRIEDILRDLWGNIEHTNIRIIGVPEGAEKRNVSEKIFAQKKKRKGKGLRKYFKGL